MKYLFLITLFFCIYSKTGFSQPNVEYTLAVAKDAQISSMGVAPDGMSYFAGISYINRSLINLIIKCNPNGDIIWVKQLGYPASYFPISELRMVIISSVTNTGFVIGANILVDSEHERSCIIQYDSSGAVEWNTLLGRAVKISSVAGDKDHALILYSSNQDSSGLEKIDSNGKVLWVTRLVTSEKRGIETAIACASKSSGYFLSGTFQDNSTILGLQYISSEGKGQWFKTVQFPENNEIRVTDIICTSDSGVLVYGWLSEEYASYYRRGAFLLKFDIGGQMVWGKKLVFETNHVASKLCELENGDMVATGYFLAGSSYWSGNLSLLLFDAHGSLHKSGAIVLSGQNTRGLAITAMNNNRICIGGFLNDSRGERDLVLNIDPTTEFCGYKERHAEISSIDSSSDISFESEPVIIDTASFPIGSSISLPQNSVSDLCELSVPIPASEVSAAILLENPVPKGKELRWRLENISSGEYYLVLRDILGRSVFEEKLSITSEGMCSTIGLRLPIGVYIGELHNDDNTNAIWRGKLVIKNN